jgi:hypothetical protein
MLKTALFTIKLCAAFVQGRGILLIKRTCHNSLPDKQSIINGQIVCDRRVTEITITTQKTHDYVLVIHGYSGIRLWMHPICSRLQSRNFRVSSWGYHSVFGSIGKHATELHQHLTGSLAQESRLHIVAHSMGAIVVRSALAMSTISNLGRVVLLAPPNTGTPVARHAMFFAGPMRNPAKDLSDHHDSYVNRLPSLDSIEIGVVAARYDTLVPVANTHLAGQSEHIVLNATHNSLLLSRTAANLTSSFLATGQFGHQS